MHKSSLFISIKSFGLKYICVCVCVCTYMFMYVHVYVYIWRYIPFVVLSWSWFHSLAISTLQAIRIKYLHPDSELQNYALQVMEMLRAETSVDAHALVFFSIICSFYFLFCFWFVLWCAFYWDKMAEISDRILCMGPNIESGEDASRPLIKANC